MSARGTLTARFMVLVMVALSALLLASCGSSGSGSTGVAATTSAADGAAAGVAPGAGDASSGGKVDDTTSPTPQTPVDRAEIERRLALARFTYVGEARARALRSPFGALAFVDSETDTLASRSRMGSDLGRVAVAPDGRLVYVTDKDEPVVWVVDAETHQKLRSIRLPGVTPSKLGSVSVTGKYTHAQLQSCSSAVACTPDGALVLVLTTAGLQVIDTASAEVVRTLPELRDGMDLAVSFDGRHAYIATTDAFTRGRHTILDWREMFIAGGGGGLALLDLETWQVVKRVSCGVVGGIAVDPDDSRVFCSDFKLKALRIVDPVTLADIAVVPLKSGKYRDFLPSGVGVLPDGSKAYVVCTAALSTTRRRSPTRALSSGSARWSRRSRGRSSSASPWTPTDRAPSPSGRTAPRRTSRADLSVTPWSSTRSRTSFSATSARSWCRRTGWPCGRSGGPRPAWRCCAKASESGRPARWRPYRRAGGYVSNDPLRSSSPSRIAQRPPAITWRRRRSSSSTARSASAPTARRPLPDSLRMSATFVLTTRTA